MTTDDRLRDMLHGAVDGITPSPPDWAEVRSRAAQPASHRTRNSVLLAAAVLVVLGAAAVLLATNDDKPSRTHVVNRPGPSTTQTTQTTVPTTTQTTLPPAPATFVATRDKSTKLVVADAVTGRTIRVLADYGPYREPTKDDPIGGTVIYGIALSTDNNTVYFTTGPEPVVGQLHKVSTAGGPVEDIGGGTMPALNLTGDRLAYVLDQDLVVRTLATKAERRYRPTMGSASTPVFSADGKWIVFEVVDSENLERFIIDADLKGPPRRLTIRGPKGGDVYQSPTPRAYDNLLGFLETCCSVDATLPPQPVAFVVVELPSGAVKGRLPLDKRMRRVDYDVTGRHQLFVDENGRLYRRDGGGAVTPVAATDITFADW